MYARFDLPLWAKVGDDPTRYHPLLAHSADVASVLELLLRPPSPFLRPLQRAAGTPLSNSHRRQLVYLAALHDLGKTNHGFQEKLREKPTKRWPRTGHVKVVVESAQLTTIPRIFREIFKPMPGPIETQMDQFYTHICHHGRPWQVAPGRAPDHLEVLWQADRASGRDPVLGIRGLIAQAREWSGLRPREHDKLPWTSAFSHLMAGMITLADWIGSTEEWFPFEPGAEEDPERYWSTAKARAENACRQLGLLVPPEVVNKQGPELLNQLFPRLFSRYDPTPLQKTLATVDLPSPGTRMVVESETGSGKTEAALTLYARLRAEGLASGLVFALPTRATSTAMYERVQRFVEEMYPVQAPSVALAIGGRNPETYSSSPVPTNEGSMHEDDRTPDEVSSWATEHHKRFLAAEVVIGTVDQVLLAGLPVRHAHLRLALLSRHLLVVDELHSYDRYMRRVLRNLLDLFGEIGGISVFLSATLSDAGKLDLARGSVTPLDWDEAIGAPYPLVSVSDSRDSGWRPLSREAVSESDDDTKPLSWQLAPDAEALDAARHGARSGARVLYLVNTVGDAVELVSRLGEGEESSLLWRPPSATGPVPYHSRFAPPDREVLDRAVIEHFGRGGGNEGDPGYILVSTQVAEQSLDVDFDLLVSHLAPIDVLLQRLGRTHRHTERSRPTGYGEPRAIVMTPDDGLASYLKGGRGPHGWGTVYENLADLELTRRAVERHPQVVLPRDNRLLVEAVYHDLPRSRLEEEAEWARYMIKAEGVGLGKETHGAGVVLPFGNHYSDHRTVQRFDAGERGIRTRLGDDSVTLELPSPVPCNFVENCSVSEVQVSLDRLRRRGVTLDRQGRPEGGIDLVEAEGSNAAFLVGGRFILRYGPLGWI